MGFLKKILGGKKKATKEECKVPPPPPPQQQPDISDLPLAPKEKPPRAVIPRSKTTSPIRDKSPDLLGEMPENPKTLTHSASAIGLDEMMENRRETGHLWEKIVHIEVPFGKPIEEVYDGVHNGPVLGSGISGTVRLVTHKATGLKYAVKVLDLGLVDSEVGLERLREEIFIMCQLDHPNIVRLEEVYESQSEIYLVQELCLGGELFDRLDEQPDYHYTEAECARLVKQMLCAVRYLHSRGIIHRDLKLENFLFSSTSPDSELKMIDFGLSKHFRYGEIQHEAVGTPYTVAPEVILGTYDERCDIWAVGVIAFLLLSGDPPFGGCGGPEPLMQVRSNILRGAFVFEPEDIWDIVTDSAKDFIRSLLINDPKDRPTAEQAQQLKWLKEHKKIHNPLNPNVVKALVNFKEFSDMRKLLYEVLSFTLLPYQIEELRREFEKMDTDGSGEISLVALKQVLLTNAGAGSLGALTESEVEDIFNAMRVRKTETRIHWHEFIAAGLSQCQVDDRNLRLAFDRLDSDHKGYIILDDIMDLMGSDALQSEDDIRRMWGDSIRAVKGQQARITYDDFLLLMKGQTREAPSHELDQQLENMVVAPTVLGVVQEETKTSNSITLPSGDVVNADGTIVSAPSVEDAMRPPKSPQSAPSTPTDHRRKPNVESALSMDDADDDDDIAKSGPGVPGSSASLTPPMSPSRGAEDYVTPSMARRLMAFEAGHLSLPRIPMPKMPDPDRKVLARRRSRSMDETDTDMHAVADAVRDLMLPEHMHNQADLEKIVKDNSKSNLVVNRKLYRAHRQMRLAVLEASKRFEEQQAEHARDLILAAREEQEPTHIQAGLVMRHGHEKQVSSKAIQTLLEKNRDMQQALFEKASRRGGRGRRSRKKTISDMSGLMNSMGNEDMTKIAKEAAAVEAPKEPEEDEDMDLSEKGKFRNPTVPGQFRKTLDPFGRSGKYGSLHL